jgi:hypothetical protein
MNCQLRSARRHARQALCIRSHRIGVPRGAAAGPGVQRARPPFAARRVGELHQPKSRNQRCRERGRSLPPPAQGNCFSHRRCLRCRPHAAQANGSVPAIRCEQAQHVQANGAIRITKSDPAKQPAPDRYRSRSGSLARHEPSQSSIDGANSAGDRAAAGWFVGSPSADRSWR